MKLSSALIALAMAYGASAHTIFQKISVNGQDKGQLVGVRATNSNYPIQNVNDPELACNKNLQYKDNVIHDIPAGARVGAWWGHVIGGPQGPNDPDHPIAASHKGPALAYLAKVDNAATTGTTGLRWFKIAEDGLTGSTWGVDRMIQNNGWQYFDIPQCIAPGNYLLRAELIALHSAYAQGEAQFYVGCAQINITGGGSSTGTNLVTFPGAYSASDPGILRNIYGAGGVPNNNGQSYPIPGPPVLNCGAQPTSSTTSTTRSSTSTTSSSSSRSSSSSTTSTSPTSTPTGSGAPLYGQCGGIGWSGPTTCASGTCKYSNDWYSQCLP